ncbi:MAG: MBL fold metallo-hydrolase [Dehalococcoidia bacterium]
MITRRRFLAGLAGGLVVAACGGGSDDRPRSIATVTRPPDPGALELTWWGQAMFVVTSPDGTRILMDPYGDIGYRLPAAEELAADIVTVSHEHPDHNNVGLVGEGPLVLHGLTDDGRFSEIDERTSDMRIESVQSFHDNAEGAERGRNAIVVLESTFIRIVHLGDLGQLALTNEQIDDIGDVDVLLIPVGGGFTIDAAAATNIVAQLAPRVVVPMHYGTPALNIDLEPVDAFLEGKTVREVGGSTAELAVDALPEPGAAEVWVLEPAGG